MSTLKVNSTLLLEAANRFFKMAQTFQYSKDPMNTALMAAMGKGLSALAGQYLNKGIASLTIYANYAPPSVTFEIYATGMDSDAVQTELANTLNTKYGSIASKIMSKYQKDKPLNYKLATFEK